MAKTLFFILILLAVASHAALAQDSHPPKQADHQHLAYGKHKRQFLHLWLPDTRQAAPLIVHFHGGGFLSGNIRNKTSSRTATRLNASGIAYADVEYRLLPQTLLTEILRDCARAIQFLRHHSAKYRLDSAKIAAYGESAGAGASLWLATRDDLANAQARDPVLRQSSRVLAAGGSGVQATYDVAQWPRILGLPPEKTPYWGMMQRFKNKMPANTFLQLRRDSDMLAHLDKDDPPLHFSPGKQGQGVHSHLFVKALQRRAAEIGADLTIQGGTPALLRFLVGHLRGTETPYPQSNPSRSPQNRQRHHEGRCAFTVAPPDVASGFRPAGRNQGRAGENVYTVQSCTVTSCLPAVSSRQNSTEHHTMTLRQHAVERSDLLTPSPFAESPPWTNPSPT